MSDSGRTERPAFPPVRLIVNADDFGRTEAINAAVAQAHLGGMLTGASLMVTADAADSAVRTARELPDLAVGLHLVVLGGRAALPPAVIPHLVDGQGRFSRRPFTAGARYFFSRTARRELAREVRAQFEAFGATGLPLSHVDGHHHMHLHPTVFRLLLPLAHEYGAAAVRLPIADELLLSLRVDRRHPALKVGWKIAFTLLAFWAGRSLRRCPMPIAHRVYGLMQTGCITESYLLRLLGHLVTRSLSKPGADVAPLVEIFCHPSLRHDSDRLGPNPGDLAALLSPAVREAVDTNGVVLTTYRAQTSRAGPQDAEAAAEAMTPPPSTSA